MIGHPKPKPRRLVKAAKKRLERVMIGQVRDQCVLRDGFCRFALDVSRATGLPLIAAWLDFCSGPSEWAHLGRLKRSRTRGMPASQRHTTAGTMILCRKHHHLEEIGLLKVEYETDRGADGLVRFEERS